MAANPPVSTAVLSHALAIKVAGRTIGAINSWSPGQNLQITPLFEFGQLTGLGIDNYGTPFEQVPGNVGGLEIGVSRWDLYSDLAEDVLGAPALDALTQQRRTFECVEVWQRPEAGQYNYQYKGCWWAQMSKQYQATGDRTINVSGSIAYTIKKLVRS